jgi:RNA polymerase sigma factor (TIGR02999 family)
VDQSQVQGEVSRLLRRWTGGDQSALADLMPLVYGELRRLGRAALPRRPSASLLQPTALVHEAWLRLAGKEHFSLGTRHQFYGLAVKLMRDILVDHMRREQSLKRGGSRIRVDLGDDGPRAEPCYVDVLVLDQALRRLGAIKARYTQIVELRYLAGLTIDETAEALKVSTATVEREWTFARGWLRRELAPGRSTRRRGEANA